MSSPEKARDFKALGSVILPTVEACVLGVGLVVREGVRTGGGRAGASNCRPEAKTGASSLPRPCSAGGGDPVWNVDTVTDDFPTASLILRTSCCSSSNLLLIFGER